MDGLVQEIRDEFDQKWQRGEVEGWSLKQTAEAEVEEAKKKAAADAAAKKKAAAESINDIDDDEEPAAAAAETEVPDFSSVESIERLGLAKLKELLQGMGAKCGGSLRQRAERLFTIVNSKASEVPLHLLKGAKGGKKRAGASLELLRPVAEREYLVSALCHELRDVLDTTLAFNEKKSIQSYEERMKDDQDIETGAAEAESSSSEDEEGEKPIYNPLNLPLGWDGKPIPYWLYKLYGLDEEYKCEICGNYSYWGRRAFDNHFQEWRHHNGMRCLGIPNPKHFHDITKIEDAKNRRSGNGVRGSVRKDQGPAEGGGLESGRGGVRGCRRQRAVEENVQRPGETGTELTCLLRNRTVPFLEVRHEDEGNVHDAREGREHDGENGPNDDIVVNRCD